MLANTPSNFFLRIDWARLRELKAFCNSEATKRPDALSLYGSIIALFDNLQLTAVDSGFASSMTVYGDPPPTGR